MPNWTKLTCINIPFWARLEEFLFLFNAKYFLRERGEAFEEDAFFVFNISSGFAIVVRRCIRRMAAIFAKFLAFTFGLVIAINQAQWLVLKEIIR